MFGSHADFGIIPRSVEFLFANIPNQYKVKASFMEIYNEKFNDLLKNQSIATLNEKLKINIDSYEQFFNVLEKISKLRKQSATSLNPSSSRSHAVIELELNKNLASTADKTVASRITFFDIAGCESSHYVPHGYENHERQNEMAYIHKSINNFRTVIESLKRNEAAPDFRSSKLTYMLKPALTSTKTKTLILTNISQKEEHFHSSKNSLLLAQSACQIKSL